jgi:hypothetical protein
MVLIESLNILMMNQTPSTTIIHWRCNSIATSQFFAGRKSGFARGDLLAIRVKSSI